TILVADTFFKKSKVNLDHLTPETGVQRSNIPLVSFLTGKTYIPTWIPAKKHKFIPGCRHFLQEGQSCMRQFSACFRTISQMMKCRIENYTESQLVTIGGNMRIL